MKEVLLNIAETLKDARKKKNISQNDLAKATGFPQSHISKIEKGLVDLQTSSLIEIARALDLEPILINRKDLPSYTALFVKKRKSTSQPAPLYQLDNEDYENE